jgi:hypothetical protein
MVGSNPYNTVARDDCAAMVDVDRSGRRSRSLADIDAGQRSRRSE